MELTGEKENEYDEEGLLSCLDECASLFQGISFKLHILEEEERVTHCIMKMKGQE